MKRVLVALAFFSLAFGSAAFAAQEGPGCGLGGMAMKGNSGLLMDLVATFLNAFSAPRLSA